MDIGVILINSFYINNIVLRSDSYSHPYHNGLRIMINPPNNNNDVTFFKESYEKVEVIRSFSSTNHSI